MLVMDNVTPITPQVRRLEAPDALRHLPGWLIWRYEPEPGTDKPLKVPYWAHYGKRFGRQGSENDRAKLVSFDEAKEAAARRGFEGVGLALLPDFGIAALDFDKCVGENRALPDEVRDIAALTYAEFSPSGTGVRAFFKGDLGNRKSLGAEHPFGVEVFSSSGFVTFTGDTLPFTEALGLENVVADVPDKVKDLCQRRFAPAQTTSGTADFLDTFDPPLGLTDAEIEGYLSDLDPDVSRDEWIRVGMAVHHETGGEGFALWDAWSSAGSKYPDTEALERQWQSFDRRAPEGRQVTMRSVLKMSEKAREARGENPRPFDPINRAAEEVRAQAKDIPANSYESPSDWTGKYKVVRGGQFAQRPEPEWIIKDLLPKAELGILFGSSGAGKSFMALDLALAICRGEPWRGLRVKPGRVLYVAAEGGGGVAQRLKAYGIHNGLDLDQFPLGVIHDAPSLLSQEDVAELVKAIVAAGSGDLIIIDTMAQVTPGANENSAEDMGKAIKHARSIQKETGSMVLFVHHSGKDATKGARGWSGIRAAADVELEVIRPEESETRVLRISKQKDGRDDLTWGFTLKEVVLGFDRDGDEMTSVVVEEAEVPKETDMAKRKAEEKHETGVFERTVLDYLAAVDGSEMSLKPEAVIGRVGETMPDAPGFEDFSNIADAVRAMGENDSDFV